MHLVQGERSGVVPGQVHLAQLSFQDQPVEGRPHFVGDNGHEVITHAHGLFQLGLGRLQARQQQLLLAAATLQRFDLLLHRLALAVQVDKHIDLALDRVNIQRLVQEVDGAAFIAFEGVVEFTARGADEHNRDVLGFLGTAHQFGQLETIHAGHLHVQNRHGELVLQQQGQGFVGAQCLEHLAVLALDQRFEGQQVFRQIVDDQQFGLDST